MKPVLVLVGFATWPLLTLLGSMGAYRPRRMLTGHVLNIACYLATLIIAGLSSRSAEAQTSTLPISSLTRSTSDRPDDYAGYQIHVMYVLPADGVDEKLDTNGTISSSIAAMVRWSDARSAFVAL
jgi:hypothetical protein